MFKSMKKSLSILLAIAICYVSLPGESVLGLSKLVEYIPFSYDWISADTNGYALAEKDGVTGILKLEDKSFKEVGNWTTISGYSFPDRRDGGAYYTVANKDGERITLKHTGEKVEIVPNPEKAPYSFYDETTQKFGIKDGKDQVIVKAQYESIGWFENGIATYMQNGKEGLIDHTGKIIVKAQYDSIYGDWNGMRKVRNGDYSTGKEGLIASDGKVILEPIYDEIGHFEADYTSIVKDGKMGVIDNKGTIVIEPKYQMVVKSAVGYTIYDDGKATYVVDLAGKTTPVKEWRLVSTGGYGYSYQVGIQTGTEENWEGKTVPTYKYGTILGNGIIDNKYWQVRPLNDSADRLVGLGTEGTEVLMDKTFKVLSQVYDRIVPKEPGTYSVVKADKYGIIGADGKEILALTYDKPVRKFNDNFYTYISGENFGFLNQEGKNIDDVSYRLEAAVQDGDILLPVGESQYIPVARRNPEIKGEHKPWDRPDNYWEYGMLKLTK